MGRPTAGHFDPRGRNVGRVDFVHGGVGRNIAEDLRNAGAEVAFLSSVDDGPLGTAVLAHLRQIGMDTSCVVSGPGGMGVWLVVMDDHGDLCASISQQLDFSLIESSLAANGDRFLAGCDALVIETDITDRVFCDSLDLAVRHGKRVYAATSNMEILLRHRERMRELFCFVCNEVEAGRLFGLPLEGLTNAEILRAVRAPAQALGTGVFIITTGKNGAVWMDFRTGESGERAPFPATVRDTSGAGDSFFSGVVYALENGGSVRSAVDMGSVFAARTIEHIGPARPDLGQYILEVKP